MEVLLIWIPISISALSAFVALLLFHRQLVGLNERLLSLERQIALARVRDEQENEKMNEVFRALASLQKTIDELLRGLHDKIDLLLLHTQANLLTRKEATQ